MLLEGVKPADGDISADDRVFVATAKVFFLKFTRGT